MNSILHGKLFNPFKAKLKGEEFPYEMEVEVIGVSCYKNEQLTFWIKGEGNWFYSYIPAHYLTIGNEWLNEQKKSFCCKNYEFLITTTPFEEINLPEGRSRVLFSIDFLNSNEILHVCFHLKTGALRIYPHREFIYNKEITPLLKKMRKTWK